MNMSVFLDDVFFFINYILGEKFFCVLLVMKIGCFGKMIEGCLVDKENIVILVNCEYEVYFFISVEYYIGILFYNIVD